MDGFRKYTTDSPDYLCDMFFPIWKKGKEFDSLVTACLLSNSFLVKNTPGSVLCVKNGTGAHCMPDFVQYIHGCLITFKHSEEKLLVSSLNAVTGNTYFQCSTFPLVSLNDFYAHWYVDGILRIPANVGQYLSPLALGIWNIAEASYYTLEENKEELEKVELNIPNIKSIHEADLLLKVLKELYDLKKGFVRYANGRYCIVFSGDSCREFYTIATLGFHDFKTYMSSLQNSELSLSCLFIFIF